MIKSKLLQSLTLVGIVGGLSVLTVQGKALGGSFVSQEPFVRPIPGPGIPGPKDVPGKEYSNRLDRRGFDVDPDPSIPNPPPHSRDEGQVIAWDGDGGTKDTTDFYPEEIFIPELVPEIDALANKSDILFDAVISNQAALLFSTDNDPNIYFEAIDGSGGIWATPPQIDQVSPDDVDGLEVWGTTNPAPISLESRENDPATGGSMAEGVDDANRYSLEIIGLLPGAEPTAVFDSFRNEVFSRADIAGAIGRPDLADDIDLDAMMMNGGRIMFSIDPLDIFDGGEIWVWDGLTPGGATFLNHGGHLWDTTFCVQCTFDTASENVNALEAVATTPEPGTILGLLAVGGVGLGLKRRSKRQS